MPWSSERRRARRASCFPWRPASGGGGGGRGGGGGGGGRPAGVDLILWGQDVIAEPGLEVPPPRFRERRFVLEPLVELAPDWVDPVTRKTVSALALDLAAKEKGA